MRFQSRRVQYLVDDSKPHPNFNARRDNGFIRAAIFFERVSGFMHFAIMVALVVAVSRFATRLPEVRIARVAFAVACALHAAAQKILASCDAMGGTLMVICSLGSRSTVLNLTCRGRLPVAGTRRTV